MNRRQAITKACLLLRRQGKEESLARFLLMYILDESPQLFSNNLSEQMSKENEDKYFSLIEKHIKEDVPLSHLVGFEYFYDRKYKVTKDVLSPRMETEELIYKVIEYIKASNKNNLKILDLCTGSGIIAITLKKELEQVSVDIIASDISEEAIKVSKENIIFDDEIYNWEEYIIGVTDGVIFVKDLNDNVILAFGNEMEIFCENLLVFLIGKLNKN